uniref:Uncharacterized protein n=1 Tax=Triticum urartu TaxID=4572 RepID=A0A8R7RFK2_TRIUA
ATSVGDVDEGDHGVRGELLTGAPLRAAEGGVPRLRQRHRPAGGEVRSQLGVVVRRGGPEREADARQVAEQRQRDVERPEQDRELERLHEPADRRHGEEHHVHRHRR